MIIKFAKKRMHSVKFTYTQTYEIILSKSTFILKLNDFQFYDFLSIE